MDKATILVLESQLSDSRIIGPGDSTPTGVEVLRCVIEKLAHGEGVKVTYGPYADDEETGSSIAELELLGHRFTLLCHWVPLGNSEQECWVIAPEKVKTIFRGLFGRRTSTGELEPIVSALRKVITNDENLTNIRWLTRQEYAALC